MNCMKCGREIKGGEPQVFCSKCLADMEAYPVKSNISIQLPIRPETPTEKKKSRRKRPQLSDEERIRHLRSKVRLLSLLLAVVFIAFVLVTLMVIRLLDDRDHLNTDAGQNYRVVAVDSEN